MTTEISRHAVLARLRRVLAKTGRRLLVDRGYYHVVDAAGRVERTTLNAKSLALNLKG